MALSRPAVVVLRALGLGDLLTGVPALRGLRRALPDHRLVLATGSNLQKLDSGGVARSLVLYDGSDNLQLLAPPDKTMAFRTGTGGFTSVRATLTAAGRLGIGTAVPDVLVHPARMGKPVRAHDADLQRGAGRDLGLERRGGGRARRLGDLDHRHSPVGRRVCPSLRALATNCRP